MVVGKRLNREQREARGDRKMIRGEGREIRLERERR
jgi:hypothetical protein